MASGDSLPGLLSLAWQRELFFFAAERMAIGEAEHGFADRLLPNASNLPNVLHTLNNERGAVFQKLVYHVSEVFPSVGNLSVRTKTDDQRLEIRVWPTEAMEHVELSFPLSSSGTGVSQVIAMLAAIMTLDKAIIIIDEINSFLHPAAVKALLRILQTKYTQHQYIISTHAPEVIAFSNPSSIHLVKRAGYESVVEQLNISKVEELRDVAVYLGVSMADVFAADRVIWVEGPTEELCFPYIYTELVQPIPRGTIFTSVAATGDFNTRKRNRGIVYEVYRRLCTAAANLLVSVVFSFDTEKLTDSEKAGMLKESKGLLRFLPRRHLECYLIDSAAIAAFIVSKDSSSTSVVTAEMTKEALQTEADGQFRIPEWKGDIEDTAWLKRVDAANLINTVCGSLTENRVVFAKKHDSVCLMRHIIKHDQAKLYPLRDYVAGLIDSVS